LTSPGERVYNTVERSLYHHLGRIIPGTRGGRLTSSHLLPVTVAVIRTDVVSIPWQEVTA
jgi:hypothetical protein